MFLEGTMDSIIVIVPPAGHIFITLHITINLNSSVKTDNKSTTQTICFSKENRLLICFVAVQMSNRSLGRSHNIPQI